MRPTYRYAAQKLGSVSLRYRFPLNGCYKGRIRSRVARFAVLYDLTGSSVSADQTSSTSKLEAILFLAKEPLHARKLAQLAKLADGTEARTLVGRLNKTYDEANRAFRIEEIAGGLQMRTRSQFANWLRRLGHVPAELRLSAPSLETLAVVAYRQPVLRADIEAIRGVACGEILRQLMERELVRVSGRSDELGRPYLYGTTRGFLQVFGLRSLDELPRAAVFRESPLDNIPDQSQAGHDSAPFLGPRHEGVTDVNVTVENQETEFPLKQKTENMAHQDVRPDDDWDDEEDLEYEDDEFEDEEELEEEFEEEEEEELEDDDYDDDGEFEDDLEEDDLEEDLEDDDLDDDDLEDDDLEDDDSRR